MELSFCNKLLALRGICATKTIIPLSSPPRKRNKHQDSCRGGNPSAKLSTQSCQPVKKLFQEQDQLLGNGTKPISLGVGNIEAYRHKIALSNLHGDYLYEDVYMRSWDLAKGIVDLFGQDSPQRKICFLCPEDVTHVVAMWSCWLTGHVAVPLCPSRSQQRLEHVILDSGCELVIVTAEHINKVHGIAKKHGQKLIVLDDTWWTEPKDEADLCDNSPLPKPFYDKDDERNANALLVYTSGMTGSPKGVLVDHQTLNNQINAVINSWSLGHQDSVLHSLSLDTLYGSINSMQAPLTAGARVTTVPVNDNVKIWSHLLGVGVKSGKPLGVKINNITIFPSIPSVYKSLISSYSELFKDKKTKEYVKSACSKRLNLMVSSTSSLPQSVTSQWKNISGHTILDTFTATESGSGLESKETQLVKFRDHTKSHHDVLAFTHESLIKSSDNESNDPVTGELRMKLSHNEDGKEEWFNTGDLVEFSDGKYSLWGKLNVYNIHIGETLVNTVNVEKLILSNKDIDDCYVVGLGDVQGDQQLAAIIVLTKTRKVNIDNILTWCSENMNKDEVPTTFKIVSSIERDKFGLINKSVLRQLFSEDTILCFHDSTL